ncbi:MAG TPA: BON domain-containing protein [Kofleriaceae bacterium]|jgi:osmotically-inducible protein OsmY|nr:BON domain-containing protein [Kofleriaceae bacterium]
MSLPTANKKTDAQIQQDVLNELKWDTRVEPTDIGVEVHDGVVTLTGTVSSWAKKVAAEEAAHWVSGVLDVANDVIVKVPSSTERSDSDIAAAVRAALRWDVFVPDDKIQSTVSDGFVTLNGEVDTYAQRNDAARAVRNLSGVRGVLNEINVSHAAVTPEALRSAIRNALERRADREVARIRIDVEGGHVTLSGDVNSWTERRAVLGAVTGTRGVKGVSDHMKIG